MNCSILDRNITHAFEAEEDGAIIDNAYWRFRNHDCELIAEHKASVLAKVLILIRCARRLALTENSDTAWIEVTEFIIDRLQHLPGRVDPFPLPAVSATLAVADKLDSLMAFFGADIRPTGSGDPYAMRRAANGVIRIAAAFE